MAHQRLPNNANDFVGLSMLFGYESLHTIRRYSLTTAEALAERAVACPPLRHRKLS
jgi:hypothetical protein